MLRFTVTPEKKPQRQVIISRMAADGIISYSKGIHPNEAILILAASQLERRSQLMALSYRRLRQAGLIIQAFQTFICLLTTRTVGTVHSHPSRSNRPSLEDLNSGFYGTISIIIAYPYEDNTMASLR